MVDKKTTKAPLLAARLEQQFPATEQQAPPRLRVLATSADELVFSGRDAEPAEAETVWVDALSAVELARSSADRPTRLLSRYRVRSARDLAARLTASTTTTSGTTTAPRRSDS